ncbi:hypothetical protein [Parasutterella muris]|uniref:hypothetical protein n=1 Tax=Parasutterella muris TaxID=2565572 RepID=UPI00203A76E0|nr:hypothetical protein [Parasutterella muris]
MTIYKEMEYKMRLPKFEKLAEGQEGQYKWLAISLGTHPCGYVSVPKNHPFYGKSYEDIQDKIRVHGGLSFGGKLHGLKDLWFGWDYAHCRDHTWLMGWKSGNDKKWTTKEIVNECLSVIKQFRFYERVSSKTIVRLTYNGVIPKDTFKPQQAFLAQSSKKDTFHLVKLIGGELYDFTTRDIVSEVSWYAWEPICVEVEVKEQGENL